MTSKNIKICDKQRAFLRWYHETHEWNSHKVKILQALSNGYIDESDRHTFNRIRKFFHLNYKRYLNESSKI
jgi:hypothetical protein